MSDPDDHQITPWNATERSRAQMRALLMALSRNRRGTFLRELVLSLISAAATLGVAPLFRSVTIWKNSRRFVRTVRIEWAQWIWQHQPLSYHADELSVLSSRGVPLGIIVLALMNLVLLILICLSPLDDGPEGFSVRWLLSGQFDFRRLWRALLILIGTGWLALIMAQLMTAIRADAWAVRANAMLADDERRQIRFLRLGTWRLLLIPPAMSVLFIQSLTNFPMAAALLVLSLALQDIQERASRRVHLQLIERLLEWMDDTGLPVEYDVTALNPDEIAAMMR